jgi:CubicO group peptidase (beta-lactamase class C family)
LFRQLVANANGVLYERAVGSFTYGQIPPRDSNNPSVTVNTSFDMASCSKVMATTTAAAALFQRGYFNIQDKVFFAWKWLAFCNDLFVKVSQYLGPKFNANNKSEVKIVNLLTHDAGFPPDPVPGYWEIAFACPETVAHPGEQASSISSLFFFFF